MKNKKTLVMGAVALFGIGFMLFMASNVVPQVLVTLTTAAPSNKVDLEQSLILADKISATADGKDEARVTVFVLDKSGKAIPGRTVSVTGLDSIQPVGKTVSDTDGKVSFKMTSSKDGQFTLVPAIDGVEMGKTIKVTFKVI